VRANFSPFCFILCSESDEERENGGSREERLASVAISADAVMAYANDPRTLSGGDPAKIIPGVRARSAIGGEPTKGRPQGVETQEQEKEKKKKKEKEKEKEKKQQPGDN